MAQKTAPEEEFEFVPDTEQGESYVPTQAETDQAAAQSGLRAISTTPEPQVRQDLTGRPMMFTPENPTPAPQGQVVRKQGSSPTDSMNDFEFVPDYQPGYDPKELRLSTPLGVPSSVAKAAGEPPIKDYLPEWLIPYASKFNDIAIGASKTLNDTIGSVAGAPVTTADTMMRDWAGKAILDNPGSGSEVVHKWMQEHGLENKVKAFDEWYGNLGEQAGTQALVTMAMVLGAPELAAGGSKLIDAGANGTKVGNAMQATGKVLKGVGEQATNHPGQVVGADVGSVVGQATLPKANETLNNLGLNTNPEVLSILGAIAGGVAGGTAATFGKIRPFGAAGTTESGMMAGIPRPYGQLINDTMQGAKSLLPSAKAYTSDDISRAVTHYKEGITAWVQDRVQKVTKGQLDPGLAAARVRAVVKEGSVRARGMESDLWGKVDQIRLVPVDTIQDAAKQVALSAQDPAVRAIDVPGSFISDIMRWEGPMSIQRLRQMATAITKESTSLGLPGSNKIPSDVMRRNLTMLSKTINDSIETAYPGDVALSKAKAFSNWYHDTFSRGPVGEFGNVRATEGYMPDAQSALKTAMAHTDKFGPQMAEMGARTGVDVQGRTEDWLRATVADAHRKGQDLIPGQDPLDVEARAGASAARAMNTPEFKAFAKAFPAMDNVLQRQFTQLQNALGRATEIRQSAFLDKAGLDPEAAASSLVNSGNKVRDAGLIMRRIGGDNNASVALATTMLRQIGDGVRWDPTLLSARLGSKDLQRSLGIILGPDQLARMNRLIDGGIEFQGLQNGASTPRKVILRAGNIMGSLLTRAAGANTIQATSIGSQAGGQIMERLFHIIPPEQMLANALVDPNWERFLLSKLPENLASMKATTRSLGALVGGIEVGHRAIVDKMDEGNAN